MKNHFSFQINCGYYTPKQKSDLYRIRDELNKEHKIKHPQSKLPAVIITDSERELEKQKQKLEESKKELFKKTGIQTENNVKKIEDVINEEKAQKGVINQTNKGKATANIYKKMQKSKSSPDLSSLNGEEKKSTLKRSKSTGDLKNNPPSDTDGNDNSPNIF